MFLLNRNWFEFICNLLCLLMTSRRLDSKFMGWDVIKQCFKLQWLLYYFPNFVTMFFCNMFDTCLYSHILAIFLIFFPANIALNKTTYMSSTFSNFTSSNKAVDGQKTDLSYSGGQCAISKHGYKTVEWRVDLENLSSISNITIYFRTENSPWGNQMKLNVYQ